MYKEASRLGLRFSSPRGMLSVEQLWQLPIVTLDDMAVSLEKAYKESANKSFIVKKTKKNKEIKLAFDIVLDVLTTKVEEQESAKQAAEIKLHNEKIYEKIEKLEDKELDNKSKKELLKLIK